MRLHGIELAKPDEYWVARASGCTNPDCVAFGDTVVNV